MSERLKIASKIMARLLAAPHFYVDNRPWNSDTDLPEIAEVCIKAADALIIADNNLKPDSVIKEYFENIKS